jgi:cellulose biosynthesis protein BcsQ
VGKTTLSIAIAETVIHLGGRRALLIDMDPQSSASEVLMPSKDLAEWSRNQRTLPHLLKRLMTESLSTDQVKSYIRSMVHLHLGRADTPLDILPNSHELWELEYDIKGGDEMERFASATRSMCDALMPLYDVVIIDCPPGRTISSDIAVEKADLVLAPINYDALSEWGMERMQLLFEKQYGGKAWRFVANRVGKSTSTVDRDRIIAHFEKSLFTEQGKRGSNSDKVFLEIPESPFFRKRLLRLHDAEWNKKRFGKLDKLYGPASSRLINLTQHIFDFVDAKRKRAK